MYLAALINSCRLILCTTIILMRINLTLMDVHSIWTFHFSGRVRVTSSYLSFRRRVSNHARVFIVNQSLIEWIYRNCGNSGRYSFARDSIIEAQLIWERAPLAILTKLTPPRFFFFYIGYVCVWHRVL